MGRKAVVPVCCVSDSNSCSAPHRLVKHYIVLLKGVALINSNVVHYIPCRNWMWKRLKRHWVTNMSAKAIAVVISFLLMVWSWTRELTWDRRFKQKLSNVLTVPLDDPLWGQLIVILTATFLRCESERSCRGTPAASEGIGHELVSPPTGLFWPWNISIFTLYIHACRMDLMLKAMLWSFNGCS